MPRPRAIRLLPALLLMLAASLVSLALPACSRKHRIFGPLNERPSVALTASATSGPSPLAVTFTAVGTDPDGTIASWAWAFSDSGTHMHGSLSQVTHTTIRVGGADRAPIVDAGIGQVHLNPGTTVFLSGSVTEPDGQPYTVQWTQQSGPAVTLSSATVLNPTFTSLSATTPTYTIRLSATDNGTPPNTGSGTVSVDTRVTYQNTTKAIFDNRCVSCHFTSNGSGIPAWQSYTEISSDLANIRIRVSPGGNMRGYLSLTPVNEANILINWIDNGAPSSNP
jgi:hypothetical protein